MPRAPSSPTSPTTAMRGRPSTSACRPSTGPGPQGNCRPDQSGGRDGRASFIRPCAADPQRRRAEALRSRRPRCARRSASDPTRRRASDAGGRSTQGLLKAGPDRPNRGRATPRAFWLLKTSQDLESTTRPECFPAPEDVKKFFEEGGALSGDVDGCRRCTRSRNRLARDR